MKQELESVQQFHQQIKALVNTTPTLPDRTVRDFRAQLLDEEVTELTESMQVDSLEATAKELADVLYVVYGTILSYGLQDKMEEIFAAVHESNMSKTSREVSANQDSKAIKNARYSAADITAILESD